MRFRSTGIAVLMVGLASAGLGAEDWTEFRGPTSQGHSTTTHLPTHWSRTENVAWSREIPGKGWSSPIILKKRLYLTTAVPLGAATGPQSLRAICASAESGEILWNVEVFQQPAGATIHDKNSHASATPVTDGKRLFVHFGPHGTACLGLDDGQVLWRNEELEYSPVHGNGGSPVLVDGLVVVNCDGSDRQFVAALDQQSGTIRWQSPRNLKPERGFSFGTPLVITVSGRKQLISAGSDGVQSFDPADGREIWRVTYPGGYSVVPRPVFGAGLLFVCTGYNAPVLLAIRPEGAKGDVTATHVVWQSNKGVPHNPSPLLVDDAIYLVSDKGVATCLDARTGHETWHQRLGGNFSSSPVYADGKIYMLSEEGVGVVFSPGREYRELARNSLEERTLASYAVGDGALFIRSERHLARIEAK
jgi:outer membrane protein assembly factor BamB